MNELVITGTVTETLTVEQGVSKTSGKSWKKGYFVIETQDQYPKKIRIAVFGDDKLNNFGPVIQPGALLNVSIDIESRSFQTRDGKTGWATDINAWKVVDAMSAAQQQYQQNNAPVFGAPANGAMTPPPPAQPAFQQQAQQAVFPGMQQPAQQPWVPTPQGMQQYQQQYPQGQQNANIPQSGAPAAPAASSDLPF